MFPIARPGLGPGRREQLFGAALRHPDGGLRHRPGDLPPPLGRSRPEPSSRTEDWEVGQLECCRGGTAMAEVQQKHNTYVYI